MALKENIARGKTDPVDLSLLRLAILEHSNYNNHF